MSHESIPNLEALQGNPELVADIQVTLSQQWAEAYADPAAEAADRSAEIILRNPSIYLTDINPAQLPEDLKDRWSDLLSFTEATVAHAATVEHQWSSNASSLEKLQALVRDGEVDPRFRGTVADVMRNASTLFAESTKQIPGNTRYYAGNVVGAAGWLRNR